jgi:hypothetical protein
VKFATFDPPPDSIFFLYLTPTGWPLLRKAALRTKKFNNRQIRLDADFSRLQAPPEKEKDTFFI